MLSRREAVIVARSWMGTPYVRAGRIRSAGCDCGTFLAEYLIGVGACDREGIDRLVDDIGFLSNDWFCHADTERYRDALASIAPLVWEGISRGKPPARPGALALFRVVGSRRYNHGAIMLETPRAIHAVDPHVMETRIDLHPLTACMEMAVFDPWAKEAC